MIGAQSSLFLSLEQVNVAVFALCCSVSFSHEDFVFKECLTIYCLGFVFHCERIWMKLGLLQTCKLGYSIGKNFLLKNIKKKETFTSCLYFKFFLTLDLAFGLIIRPSTALCSASAAAGIHGSGIFCCHRLSQ